jgi:hypothetical protein
LKKASEYALHAQECRALARTMETGEQRDQLLKLARMWERLAADRSDPVREHPELALAADKTPPEPN